MRSLSDKDVRPVLKGRALGVVFSQSTGELRRVVQADNLDDLYMGAALQPKECLVLITERDFRGAQTEELKPSHIEDRIKPLIMSGALDGRSIDFDEYLKRLFSTIERNRYLVE